MAARLILEDGSALDIEVQHIRLDSHRREFTVSGAFLTALTREQVTEKLLAPAPVKPPERVALANKLMLKGYSENPRKDLYRSLSLRWLFNALCQNIEELEIALKYGNDVEDKAGDVLNYVSFILHNWVNPPEGASTQPTEVTPSPGVPHKFTPTVPVERVSEWRYNPGPTSGTPAGFSKEER